jgi:hypothetical protein
MPHFRTCDGVVRRDFLKAGALGGSALTLSNFLRWTQAADQKPAPAKSAIFVNLAGGPSHLDTFDLKPESPAEYRGEFQPIDTNVPGLRISEHLPQLARVADKFALLRGVSHSLAAHELGSKYMNTGNRPLPSLEFPGYGSIVAKEFAGAPDLPPFVAVPNTPQKPGYLGVRYAALSTGQSPKAGQPFNVRGVSLEKGLTVERFDQRQTLLRDLDQTFAGYEKDYDLLDGLDRFSQQAYQMISSPAAKRAFDISQESPAFADPFGKTDFGLSCLLAVRLVEAGVRFVSLQDGGWDTHNDNWTRLKEKLLPPFDTGLSALLAGLDQRGLLSSTAVFVTGEFGRTPKINQQRNGRDHYPRAMFVLQAGGAVRGGQVLGASDEKGEAPAGDGFSPDDVAATFFTNLGIDPHKEYETHTGRPVMLVRNGRVIRELVG